MERMTGMDLNGDGRIGGNYTAGGLGARTAGSSYSYTSYSYSSTGSGAGAANAWKRAEQMTGVDLNNDGRIGWASGQSFKWHNRFFRKN